MTWLVGVDEVCFPPAISTVFDFFPSDSTVRLCPPLHPPLPLRHKASLCNSAPWGRPPAGCRRFDHHHHRCRRHQRRCHRRPRWRPAGENSTASSACDCGATLAKHGIGGHAYALIRAGRKLRPVGRRVWSRYTRERVVRDEGPLATSLLCLSISTHGGEGKGECERRRRYRRRSWGPVAVERSKSNYAI